MSTIRWTGDLDADCRAEHKGMVAHCEAIGDCQIRYDRGLPTPRTHWFASVSLGDAELFHSSGIGGIIIGGDMARAICEAVMLAYAAGRKGLAT